MLRATGQPNVHGHCLRYKHSSCAHASRLHKATRCSQPTQQLSSTPGNPSGNEFPLLGLGRIDTLLPGVYCFENAVWLRDLVPLAALNDTTAQSAAAQLAALTARASATAAAAATSAAEAECAAHAAACAAAAATDAATAASTAASLARPAPSALAASLSHPASLMDPAPAADQRSPVSSVHAASLSHPAPAAALTHPVSLIHPASARARVGFVAPPHPESSLGSKDRGVGAPAGSHRTEQAPLLDTDSECVEALSWDVDQTLSLDAAAAHLAAVAALAATEAVAAAQAAAEAAAALVSGQARVAAVEQCKEDGEETEEPGYRTADRVSLLRVPMRPVGSTLKHSSTSQPGQFSPSPPHSLNEAHPGTSPHALPHAVPTQRIGLQERGRQLLAWLVRPVVMAVQALLRALRAARAVLCSWGWTQHSMQSRGQQGSGDGDVQGSVDKNLRKGRVYSNRAEGRASIRVNGAELHANSAHCLHDVGPGVTEERLGMQDSVAKQHIQSRPEDKQRSLRQVQEKSSSSSSGSSNVSNSLSSDDGSGMEPQRSGMLVVSKLSRFKDPETGKTDYFKMAASANEYSCFVKHAQHTQHRNLVQMLGCARDGESLTLLSEFSEGGDLQQLLKKEQDIRRAGKAKGSLRAAAGVGGLLIEAPQVQGGLDGLSEQQLLHIARDLLAGLAALQRGGLTHGDIKPSNCFVSYTEGSPCGDLELRSAPVAPSPLSMEEPATDKTNDLFGEATSGTAGAFDGPIGPQPHLLASQESHSSVPSSLASTSTFSIDSSIEEEEDKEAVVLQPPIVPSGAPNAGSVSGLGLVPAQGLAAAKQPTSLLAFTPSATNSGLLLPTKPKLRRSKVFKLGDYGTLREKGRQHLHYFVSGFGYTPEYAAPEALRYGTAKAHAPADIWAVGVTLLELLLGRLPTFAVKMRELQNPDDHKARQRWLSKNKPADLRDLHDAVAASESGPPSLELQEVLSACLQLRPERRPQSADELLRFAWFAAPASKAWLVE